MDKILETNNFGRFILSDFNRKIRRTWHLEKSFKVDGFRDDEAISVTRVPNPKPGGPDLFRINDGHHRFYVARKLGIPVKYKETKLEPMAPSRKAKTTRAWNLQDCLEGYVNLLKPAYLAVKAYQVKTGIHLSACISMLTGGSAGSGNWTDQFKDGEYTLGDPAHANLVGDLVIHCRKEGCEVPQVLVNAFSKLVWAVGFDSKVMKNKISLFPNLLNKKNLNTKDEYIHLLEDIYNKKSQTRVPLAFNADEAARKRMPTKPKRKKPWLRPEPEKRPAA